jgi:hypothetical protein
MLRTKVVEKKKHILCSVTYFRKSCFYEKMWKNSGRPGEATDDNMAHELYMLNT